MHVTNTSRFGCKLRHWYIYVPRRGLPSWYLLSPASNHVQPPQCKCNCARLYLPWKVCVASLSAALSQDLRTKLGITHILSVCPEYTSTGPNHLTIPVQDSEYEDLLIHLPKACAFIQNALDQGGKVLVHCVMGVSRSTTVVCAYLMKTRRMSASAAIRFVKRLRPRVHPNYGFVTQLHTFAECGYEPSSTNEVYISWKRKQGREMTNFLNTVVDTVPVIPDQLFLSSDFPSDPEQAESLLIDLGITHLLSISPAQISSAVLTSVKHHHINLPSYNKNALLVVLPDTCKFIRDSLESGGQVLVHCLVESRACTVVCAYLMASRKIPPSEAFSILEDALPLFNPTHNFSTHLDLFEACGYAPTPDHPLVKEWVGSPKGSVAPDANTSAATISAAAACVLSDTGIDMNAFGEALAQIQQTRAVKG